jgi:hypothetical protein
VFMTLPSRIPDLMIFPYLLRPGRNADIVQPPISN